MINLSPDICRKAREARRAAKLSQVELAAELGCNQSAISMFEKGDGTKLNDEVVKKILEKFAIELPAAPVEAASIININQQRFINSSGALPHSAFCPNHECTSNHPYQIGGEMFFMPDREAADPVGGRYCAICGEVLIRRCPACGAPVHAGAICSLCGERYVQ